MNYKYNYVYYKEMKIIKARNKPNFITHFNNCFEKKIISIEHYLWSSFKKNQEQLSNKQLPEEIATTPELPEEIATTTELPEKIYTTTELPGEMHASTVTEPGNFIFNNYAQILNWDE
jgi:hypothetical protein